MSTRQAFATSGLTAALLFLSACAGGSSGPADGGLDAEAVARDGGPEGAAQSAPREVRDRPLFISPAGEPFHGAPDGPAPVATWFVQVDADHDGRLTRVELAADYDRFFKRLDTNGDGVIDGFEAQAYERTIAPELLPQVGRLRSGEGQDENLFKPGRGGAKGRGRGGPRPSRDDTGPGRGTQAAGAYQLFPDLEPITSADANLDGRVALSEWRARAAAVFGQLDVSDGGFVTLAVLPQTPQQKAIEKRKAAEAKRRLR